MAYLNYSGQLYALNDSYIISTDLNLAIEYIQPNQGKLSTVSNQLTQQWGRVDPTNPNNGIDTPLTPGSPETFAPERRLCQFPSVDRTLVPLKDYFEMYRKNRFLNLEL